jgi:hypothetical protein
MPTTDSGPLSVDVVFHRIVDFASGVDAVRLARTCRNLARALARDHSHVFASFSPQLLGQRGYDGALKLRWRRTEKTIHELDLACVGFARGLHVEHVRALISSEMPLSTWAIDDVCLTMARTDIVVGGTVFAWMVAVSPTPPSKAAATRFMDLAAELGELECVKMAWCHVLKLERNVVLTQLPILKIFQRAVHRHVVAWAQLQRLELERTFAEFDIARLLLPVNHAHRID